MRGLDGAAPPFLRGLGIAASGLSAQRRRLDVIAMNIANAETTRTAEGGPYNRKHLELATADPAVPIRTHWRGGEAHGAGSLRVPRVPPASSVLDPLRVDPTGVQVEGVSEITSEGPLVYEPGHPDADPHGYVRYPNVDLTQETVALMEARRMYEANATVFEAMKSMLRRALEI